jgi:nucleoside-diphosphate-sugar epimerase
MRVLVTGAAGLVGTAVLDLLAERGVPVTALVLQKAPDLLADRVVVGDACSAEVVDEALRDVTDVIHLAAIPSPLRDPGEIVFGHNTLATFTVLDRAGQAGVARAAIASSYAICGLPFARRPLRMPYLPIDAGLPLQFTDPYALSKQVDEATALMVHQTVWDERGGAAAALRGDGRGPPGRDGREIRAFAAVRGGGRVELSGRSGCGAGSRRRVAPGDGRASCRVRGRARDAGAAADGVAAGDLPSGGAAAHLPGSFGADRSGAGPRSARFPSQIPF